MLLNATSYIIETSQLAINEQGWRNHFGKSSALNNNILPTDVMNETRTTAVGDIVDCYRNLHRADCFSIRQRHGEFKNKVSGYAQSVIIKHPQFIVSEASRQRVLREKSRNVHAFVRGEFTDAYMCPLELSKLNNVIRVSYSPYLGGTFFQKDTGFAITQEDNRLYAVLCGSDVFLTDF